MEKDRKIWKIGTVVAIIAIGLLVSGCPRWWHKHPHNSHKLVEPAR